MSDASLHELRFRLRAFAAARDRAQCHTPKNLAMALTGEVGALVEIFQRHTPGRCARRTASRLPAAAHPARMGTRD